MILLSSLALAAPPNRQADLISVLDGADEGSGGVIDTLVVSSDGDVLVGRLASATQGFVLDLDTWAMLPIEGGCGSAGVTGITAFDVTNATLGFSTSIWMSCSDGTIEERSYDGQRVSDAVSVTEVALENTLSAIFHDPFGGDDLLYALELPEGFARVYAIAPQLLDSSGPDTAPLPTYPQTLTNQGYTEGRLALPPGDQRFASLVVSHDRLGLATPMSTLILNGSNLASRSTQLAICDDMAATALPNTVYCLDTENGLVQAFTTLTNTFLPVVGLAGLVGPRAIGASDSLTDNWIAVTGSQVQVWRLDEFGVVQGGPVFSSAVDADNPIREIVGYDGYLFGGGASGRLHVVTARPWIERETFSIEPLTVASGETVTVRFTVEQPQEGSVSWAVTRGGDRSGSGVSLGQGTVSAGEEVVVTFETNGLPEGLQDVFVVVTDDDDLTGHIAGTIQVDNVPTTPVLPQRGISVGNRRLDVTFDGISDADLDRYEVCVSLEEFDPTTLEDCPEYTGQTRFTNDLEVDADPGVETTITIQPLENDVKHYIAVRAVDANGNLGAYSNVVSETPNEGNTAANLAGEEGGSPCAEGCATSGGGGWGFGLAGLLAAALLRRRRSVAALALVGFGLAATTSAHAQDDDGGRQSVWLRKDSTPVRGDFEFRYGNFVVNDPNISEVHGNSINLWQIEAGPQIFRFVEIDLGIALANPKSPLVNTNNSLGSRVDETRLTIIPLTADVTLRAHVLDEQPIVPFVRYGWDYAFFTDKRVDEDREPIRGAKVGTHWGAGVNLLVDILAPNRASLLEAQSGINDTWITLEWRRNRIDDRSRPWSGAAQGGLDLSGDVFSVGLKLDY